MSIHISILYIKISTIHYSPLRDIKMLKKTVVIFAAAAFFGGAVPTQTAQARDYYNDDDEVWDLMNPAWWAEEMFDDDDDDWRRYRHYRHSPYWGAPYRQHPQVIVIQPGPETTVQNPETRPPQ
jgi:hypothetical protein